MRPSKVFGSQLKRISGNKLVGPFQHAINDNPFFKNEKGVKRDRSLIIIVDDGGI